MNFEEALLQKQEAIKESGGTLGFYDVIIVPQNPKEFEAFIEFFKRSKYTDELCKMFSSDGKFTVHLLM